MDKNEARSIIKDKVKYYQDKSYDELHELIGIEPEIGNAAGNQSEYQFKVKVDLAHLL